MNKVSYTQARECHYGTHYFEQQIFINNNFITTFLKKYNIFPNIQEIDNLFSLSELIP